MRDTPLRFGTAALALGAVLVLGACDDDPVDHHDDHPEPVGMVIRSGGADIVTVDDTTVTGSLTVDADAETGLLTILFVDDDGDRFTPDDDDEWLRVDVADPAVADWEATEAGAFSGTLVGLAGGTTAVVFELMHGPLNAASAHADYTSPSIPVVVEDDDDGEGGEDGA